MKCIHSDLFFFSFVRKLSSFQKQSTMNLREGLLHLTMSMILHAFYLKVNHCVWKALQEGANTQMMVLERSA